MPADVAYALNATEADSGPMAPLAVANDSRPPVPSMLTPLMPYFPLMVVFAARYQKDAGIGTVIALMIPYALVVFAAWLLLFVGWYLIGIPLGPGWPV